ncbi:Oidioi.mRNA.OKI2018_I69.chr1.g1745.t1.cds [Oikopleura dioica]|uniref:Oidioi.mRNA.OKI2018_I69.chr1.g1745.t1.cds n=1 Tax=Oikopleura dioica TaxID=34765 RepID=A0ABN7ST30_OIKDI|nr:Oidioi.mRNA.OKI2018_I69.chr1.g1745.t1.cds [Oikopleura dioica]
MGKPKEDEIPLLEPNHYGRKNGFNRQRIRPTLTLPLKKDYESIKYKIQAEDSLDSIALRFAVGKEELKRANNLFSDDELITRRELSIPDRRITELEGLKQAETSSVASAAASGGSSPVGDASELLARIQKSTTETASKMNDIRIELPKTEAELRNERESLLDGMFGASEQAATAELALQARYPRRDIVFSVLCLVTVAVGIPVLIYYNLAILHMHIEP